MKTRENDVVMSTVSGVKLLNFNFMIVRFVTFNEVTNNIPVPQFPF